MDTTHPTITHRQVLWAPFSGAMPRQAEVPADLPAAQVKTYLAGQAPAHRDAATIVVTSDPDAPAAPEVTEPQELDLSAAARVLQSMSQDQWSGATRVWEALTGLDGLDLERYLDRLTGSSESATATVVPF